MVKVGYWPFSDIPAPLAIQSQLALPLITTIDFGQLSVLGLAPVFACDLALSSGGHLDVGATD